MTISIIIILKNDLGIVDTLEALNKQQYDGKFEVIVVDRSTIKYPKIIHDFPLNWINYDPKGKRYTIPQQRNVGVKQATGDIIVFLDASCVPEEHWLEEITKPIIHGSEVIVMGRTGSAGGKTLNDLAHEKLKQSKYVSEAPTINLAIKRSVFSVVGSFDEQLEYGSDVDFSWRSIDSGLKIKYQPTAFLTHDWGDQKQIKRTILYGRARARLLIKHRATRWKNLFSSDSPVVIYPLLILGLPISIVYPPYLLLFVLLVLKNIKEPNPIGIVAKHIVYGWGVILEIANIQR